MRLSIDIFRSRACFKQKWNRYTFSCGKMSSFDLKVEKKILYRDMVMTFCNE